MLYKIFALQYLFVIFSFAMNIEYLEKNSMLYQAKELAKKYSGKKTQWQHPYGLPKTTQLLDTASNWFTSYAFSTMHPKDVSLWDFLGGEKLWDYLEEIGIDAIHLGPMKIAGQLTADGISPTVDGGFDPISYTLDPAYGSYQDYMRFVKTISEHRAIIIGDMIPGHTGRGYDFQLALLSYKNYPGIYHMIEIEKEDWSILPETVGNNLSINLSMKEVESLKNKGYIVGKLQRVLFYDPKMKQTNWDATKIIKGVDGKERRWVYLHYFKSNQPTLDWLDPSFAANQLIGGDIITSLDNLQQQTLRIDANAFLGIEQNPNLKKAWSESHPLSIVTNDTLAMFIRKLGGFSFQELNMSLKEIRMTLEYGPDLSYDFLMRAAAFHALLHENTEFLRLVYQVILENGLEPKQFVHALQNHDEINYELIHFFQNNEKFFFRGKEYAGSDLRKKILDEDTDILVKQNNYTCSIETGACTTIAGLCAAALKIPDIYRMNQTQKDLIQKAHLLLAFFSSMQPGAFALSGWDMVGALPIKQETIERFITDGDNRWANRGGYDLMGCCKEMNYTDTGLPKSYSLYGSIPEQMKNPHSFLSILKSYLKVRKQYTMQTACLVSIPATKNPAVFILLHRLSGTNDLQMTALNFSQKNVEEIIESDDFFQTNALNLLTRKNEEKKPTSKKFHLQLTPLQGKAILFQPYRG